MVTSTKPRFFFFTTTPYFIMYNICIVALSLYHLASLRNKWAGFSVEHSIIGIGRLRFKVTAWEAEALVQQYSQDYCEISLMKVQDRYSLTEIKTLEIVRWDVS